MTETLAILFAQLDIAVARYELTETPADDIAVDEICRAIAKTADETPYPSWYAGEPVPFEWNEGMCCRLYSIEVGSTCINGDDTATPAGVVHTAAIGEDCVDPPTARARAADLVRAALILDLDMEP
ncbi:hypothetical protein EN35_31635 [Rhodococcus qingshengii]|nr:hypothetical protein EN35_31635 [Rhodococcus qingshengii]